MTEEELNFLRSYIHIRFSAVNPEIGKKIRGMLHFARSKVLYYKDPRSSETQAISDMEIVRVLIPSGSCVLRYWTEDGKEGQRLILSDFLSEMQKKNFREEYRKQVAEQKEDAE